jgi:Transposase and inactivated derivatives
MVRNTLKYVANKDMKAFAKDLKTIYTAPDEEAPEAVWKMLQINGNPSTQMP